MRKLNVQKHGGTSQSMDVVVGLEKCNNGQLYDLLSGGLVAVATAGGIKSCIGHLGCSSSRRQ
jgi:hypothetical protein